MVFFLKDGTRVAVREDLLEGTKIEPRSPTAGDRSRSRCFVGVRGWSNWAELEQKEFLLVNEFLEKRLGVHKFVREEGAKE